VPCFLKHGKGNGVGWLNPTVATTVITLWKKLYDTVDNNGQDNTTFQNGKMKIDFIFFS